MTGFADNYNRSQSISLLSDPKIVLFGEPQFAQELLQDLQRKPCRVDSTRLLASLMSNNFTPISFCSDYKSVSAIIQSQENVISFAKKLFSNNTGKYCVQLTPRQILLFVLLTEFSNIFFSVMYMLWLSLERMDPKNTLPSA